MADPSSPPKKKKLPFKPTALRRAAAPAPTATPAPAGAEDSSPSNDGPRADDLALFRRGKEMAPMLAADLERRRRKKEKQKQAEDERRRSSLGEKRSHDDEEYGVANAIGDDDAVISPLEDAVSPTGRSLQNRGSETAVADDLFTPPPSKRSRNNDSFADEANVTAADVNGSQEYPGLTQASPSTRTTRSQANRYPQPETTQLPPSTAAIVLDSDSEPEIHASKAPTSQKPREVSVEVTQESQALDDDDDFADYVRKAEAERARQREEQQRQQQAQQDVFSPSGRNTTPSTQNAEILVTSSIPGSTPCKALVRFDQPLRLLRDSWAAKQRNRAGLPIQDSDTILTWRRSRVYNTSTLYNLNLSPLGDGRIKASASDGTRSLSRTYSSSSTTEGLSNDRTQVLFEAWTTASFAEMEREEARRKEGRPSSQPDGHASDDNLEEDEEDEEDVTLKVLLRARGLPDIGLTVRPATTSETLIMAFRNQVANANPDAIPAGMGVQLWFDGEQLEEHMTLEEADIADRDIIEVHLRPT